MLLRHNAQLHVQMLKTSGKTKQKRHLVDLHICGFVIDILPLWRWRVARQEVQQSILAIVVLEDLGAVLRSRATYLSTQAVPYCTCSQMARRQEALLLHFK